MARHANQSPIEPALERFAEQLRTTIGAQQVWLFGSHAHGNARHDSDYDLIIIAPQFSNIEHPRRAMGLRQLWYEVGGKGPMDLICLTPDEFENARSRITMIAAVMPDAVSLLPERV